MCPTTNTAKEQLNSSTLFIISYFDMSGMSIALSDFTSSAEKQKLAHTH